MTEPSAAPGPDIVVLLAEVPTTMGEVFGNAIPALVAEHKDIPPFPLRITTDGNDLDLRVHPTPVPDDSLLRDLGTSPLAPTLHPAVDGHAAHATFALVDPITDPWDGFEALSTLAAFTIDQTGAKAVWLPAQSIVTTDVMYLHDVENAAERAWFRTHAMWLDEAQGLSLGFTRGLTRFGWPELQLSGLAQDPAQTWERLTAAVAERLLDHRPPEPGDSLDLAGIGYTLQPGTDLLGDPVLDLVPARKKRRWFGRG